MIPKNIIGNIISGFIPNKIGGEIMCKTAPIPINNANNTKSFVLILISPQLSSFFNFHLCTHCQMQSFNNYTTLKLNVNTKYSEKLILRFPLNLLCCNHHCVSPNLVGIRLSDRTEELNANADETRIYHQLHKCYSSH